MNRLPGVILDPIFRKGVQHFNRQEYFDAHEVWEGLWVNEKGEARNLLQGLIQIATAFHHFRQGNFRGARILFETGSNLLKGYGNEFWGVEISKLIDDTGKIFVEIMSARKEDLPGKYDPPNPNLTAKWEPEKAPLIELGSA